MIKAAIYINASKLVHAKLLNVRIKMAAYRSSEIVDSQDDAGHVLVLEQVDHLEEILFSHTILDACVRKQFYVCPLQ